MVEAAIVGLGRWGKNLVQAVHQNSDRISFIRAIDAAPERVRAFAEERALPLLRDFDALLQDRAVQALVIVTPHSLHRRMVEVGARAGKHVFCEKPLALTSADARAMVDSCEKVTRSSGAQRFTSSHSRCSRTSLRSRPPSKRS